MPSSKSKRHNSSSKIILNVGGYRHETYLSTLRNIPDTRLSNLSESHKSMTKASEYDSTKNEYFFDRHPGVFAHVLNYYRIGKLHCPNDICGPLFEEELDFWGIDEEQVETCCWEVYKQHKEKQEKLKCFKLPGFDEKEDNVFMSQDSGLFEAEDDISWWSRFQPKVWKSLEDPHSSQHAKIMGVVSFVVFVVYIIKFSLSTLTYFRDHTSQGFMVLSILHMICLAWFTLDFSLRVVFSPHKRSFLKSICTWTDFISLIPLYVFLLFPYPENIRYVDMLVMLKAARIFELFKLSYVLQVLVNTLKASSRELCIILVIMAFQTAVFSSILYFVERKEPKTDFSSVPHSMWWAIITMTTVGYGDVSPQTWMGKIVGSACAICGVLVIALPVSVISSNFSIFYTYAKARLNIPLKTRRVALSHALTSMQIPRTSRPAGYPSMNHTSFSSMDRRNTQRTLNASETSFNVPSSHQGSLATSKDRSPSNSLHSLSLLETPRTSDAKPVNSLFFGATPFQYPVPDEDMIATLAPSKKTASALELSRPKIDGSADAQDLFLSVPHKGALEGNNKHLQASNLSLFIGSTYPLYLRRGAVTPASTSLKSNSTNSSINHLLNNISFEGLNIKRPVIFLSRNSLSTQNLRSIQALNPGLVCSCASMKSQAHIHSADDSVALTPIICDMFPCVISNPTINFYDSKQSCHSQESIYTNGPTIEISSPSDEKLRQNHCEINPEKSRTSTDKCSAGVSSLTRNSSPSTITGNMSVPDIVFHHELSDTGQLNTENDQRTQCTVNGEQTDSENKLSLVNNPLHELAVPQVTKCKKCDFTCVNDNEIHRLNRSTTL